MKKLTLEALTAEFESWIESYGDGRNEDDIRFGQYIWAHYDLNTEDFDGPDGFYAELPALAFDQLVTVCE